VAAQLLFTFRDRILLACAASLREFLSLSPNNLLYWESIRYGCETGLRYCDLGRSTRNTGPFDFKAQWGGEQRPFTTYFANRDGAAAMASGDSSRYRLFRRVWQRLPLPVVNAIGPRIVKGLP
jgi:CelD/BcsL family acetyltransferase involved in cellulose biosynthesis